ncbi:MAG: Ig-like domain-containing protein [Candidatus Entotheonellia bacterium]
MKCRDMIGRMICSLLLALPLAGCDYGDRNKDPVADNETAITAREVPVTINALANDSDPDGDPLEVVGVTQGVNGEVALNDDGTVTYTPAKGFDGTDSFTYTIDDDHGGQAIGTVTVTVLPDPGVVVGGTLSTVKDVSPEGVADPAAWGINDTGQIAASGVVEGDEVARPLFIDADGSIAGIFVPGVLGRAFGINNNGTICGFFFEAVGEAEEVNIQGTVQSPNALNVRMAFPQANGEDDEEGEDEAKGEEQLVGRSFVWDSVSRSLVAIYDIPDAVSTTGFKINDAGVIVGQVQLAAPEDGEDSQAGEDEGEEPAEEGPTLGFIRASDGIVATFSVPGSLNTFLGGINNQRQIVGGFNIDAGEEALLFGFIRNADGTFSAFNVPNEEGNPLWTKADDINDAGDIVGLFRPEAGEEAIQGFLRKADGTILHFSLPGFEEARFTDINNRGVISGFGIDVEGVFHAVVLTPITPAPNTFFEDVE